MTLPTDISNRYPDQGSGDRLHQEHHDVIHEQVNVLTNNGTSGQMLVKQADGSNDFEDKPVEVASGQTTVTIWRGSQSDLPSIGSRDSDTLYFVTT